MNKGSFIKYAKDNFTGDALKILLDQINLFYSYSDNFIVKENNYNISDDVILKKEHYFMELIEI